MNVTCLMGRLTKDPELRANGDKMVASFYLAVNRDYDKDNSDFIPCVAFGKRAETIGKYLFKGSKITINGHLRTESYTGKDGTTKYSWKVVVDNFYFCESKKSGAASPAGQPEEDSFTPADPEEDEGLPF